MKLIHKILAAIFGKSYQVIDLKLAFHKDANLYGHHGYLLASHRAQKLEDTAIRFVFIGLTHPPVMTPRIMEYVWEEARSQGYIPHALVSYGNVLQTTYEANPDMLVRQPKQMSASVAVNALAHAREVAMTCSVGNAHSSMSMPNSFVTKPQHTATE